MTEYHPLQHVLKMIDSDKHRGGNPAVTFALPQRPHNGRVLDCAHCLFPINSVI